jgi:hypothetical protein
MRHFHLVTYFQLHIFNRCFDFALRQAFENSRAGRLNLPLSHRLFQYLLTSAYSAFGISSFTTFHKLLATYSYSCGFDSRKARAKSAQPPDVIYFLLLPVATYHLPLPFPFIPSPSPPAPLIFVQGILRGAAWHNPHW